MVLDLEDSPRSVRTPAFPDLFPENTIFLNEISDHVLLSLIDPAGE
jgi:hypothetical protein